MKISKLDALRVRIPQTPPIAPYQNRYRAGTYKEALLVRLETDNGLFDDVPSPLHVIERRYMNAPAGPAWASRSTFRRVGRPIDHQMQVGPQNLTEP